MPATDPQSEDRFDEQTHLALDCASGSREELYEEHGIDRTLDDPDASDGRTPPDWQDRKSAVADYYDGKCARCGRDLPDGWHCHHVQEVSKHGTHELRNLVALCPECHALLHPFMDDIDWSAAPMFPASDADPRVAVERRPVSAPEDRWYADQYLGGEESLGGSHNYQSRSGATTKVPAVAAVQKDNPTEADLERLEAELPADDLVALKPRSLPFYIGEPGAMEDDQRNAWWEKRRTVAATYADELDVDLPWRDRSVDETGGDDSSASGEEFGGTAPSTSTQSGAEDAGFDELVLKHEVVMGVGIALGTFAVLFVAVLLGYLVDGVSERLAGAIAGVGLLGAVAVALFGTWVAAASAAFGAGDSRRAIVGPWVLATVPGILLLGYPVADSDLAALTVVSYVLCVRLGAVVGRDWERYAPVLLSADPEDSGHVVVGVVVLLAALPSLVASLPLRGGPFEVLLDPSRALVRAYTPVLDAFAPAFATAGIDYRAVSGYPFVGWPLALAVVSGTASSLLYCIRTGRKLFR